MLQHGDNLIEVDIASIGFNEVDANLVLVLDFQESDHDLASLVYRLLFLVICFEFNNFVIFVIVNLSLTFKADLERLI